MAAHETVPLWEYAAGTLPPEARAEVDRHLAECPECTAALEGARRARSVLDFAELAPPPAVDWRRVNGALHEAAARKLSRRGLPGWSVALAGGALAAACAAWLVLGGRTVGPSTPSAQLPDRSPVASHAPAPSSPPARVEASRHAVLWAGGAVRRSLQEEDGLTSGDELRTGPLGNASLRLPDGSQVRVAAVSELLLLEVKPDEVALRLGRGRLLAQAAHVPRKGFRVEAGGVVVRVVGTVFSVATSAPGEVEVAVVEGRVRVELPSGGERSVGAGERLLVHPGEARTGPFSVQDRAELQRLGVELPAPAPTPPRPRPQGSPPPPPGPMATAAAAEPSVAPPSPERFAPRGLEEAPASPGPALIHRGEPLPSSVEAIFLRRAEEGLRAGRCEGFLLGLDELLEHSEDLKTRSKARILRARCFDDRLMPTEALREYRHYLDEFPAGEFAPEARRAVEE